MRRDLPAGGEAADGESAEDVRGRAADALADDLLGSPPGHAPVANSEVGESEGAALRRGARALAGALALSASEIADLLAAEGTSVPPAPPPTLPPDLELLDEIGRGGMGVVYRARQRSLGRLVAVKVLRPGEWLFGAALQRFAQEARILARLRHPNIVGVHEVGEHEGRLYFTMDLIEGRPLSVALRDGPLTLARTLSILKQVAAAVAYVHAHGLVHRDLKPSNILLSADDHVTVTDFGLALELGAVDGLTLTGQVVGTPGYMSPEQARGDLASVGEASDVHALGVLLYESLTGQRPFRHLSPAEQVYAVIHQDAPLARRVRRSVPPELERVAAHAMRKRPAERYATARAFLEELERFEEGRPVRAPARGWPYLAGRFLRRHGRALAGGALALTLLAALLGALGGLGRPSPRETLLHAARDVARAGNAEAAVLLYERARRVDEQADEFELDLELARARVDWAQSLWEQGRSEQAASMLEAAIAQGQSRYRLPGKEPGGGPLRWALGTVRGLQGRWIQAHERFGEARRLHGWNPGESGAWVRARPFGSDGGSPGPWVLARFAAALGDPAHPSRQAALVMLPEVEFESYARAPGASTSQGPSAGVEPGPLLRAWLEAVVLRRSTGDPYGAARAQGVRDLFDRAGSEVLAPALVEVARDAGAPDEVRRLAAALLADRLDLPEVAATHTLDEAWGTQEPAAVLAQYDMLTPLPAHERLALRLERAFGLLAATEAAQGEAPAGLNPGERDRLQAWFRARAGAPAEGSWSELLAWWEQNRHEDARLRLAARLGLPGMPREDQAHALALRMSRAGAAEQRTLHHLLALLRPAADGLEPPRNVQRDGMQAARHWMRRLVRPSGIWRLRVARVRLEPGGPVLDPRYGRVARVDVERPFGLAHETLGDGPLQPRLELQFPPGRTKAASTASRFELSLELDADEGGPLMRVLRCEVRGPPGTWRKSSRGATSHLGYVMAANLEPGSWSHPDWGRHEVLLALLEPDVGHAEPWDLARWTARVEDDVRRAVADVQAELARARAGGEPGFLGAFPTSRTLYAQQHPHMRLAMLGTRLPLPGARDALGDLRELFLDASEMHYQALLLLRAGLIAGDESPLSDPRYASYLEGRSGLGRRPRHGRAAEEAPVRAPEEDDYEGTSSGRGGEYWARLFAWTPSDRLRALARTRLEALELSDRAAGDLERARAAGRVTLSPALADRVERGPTEDTTFWGQARQVWWAFALAGLSWSLVLLALGLALGPARRAWQRLRPAGWLVVLGALVACVRVEAAGIDVLPDAAGLAFMALGSLLLGRHVRGWLRGAAALLFGGAALLLLLNSVLDLPPALSAIAAGASAVGVGLLPLLGRALRGHPERPLPGGALAGPREAGSPGRVRLAAAIFVVVGGLAVGSSAARHALMPWFLILGLVVLALLARPLARGLAAVSRGTWPWPFVLFYLLPVGLSLAAGLVALLGGPAPNVRIEGTLAGVLLFAFGCCVLWAVAQPLRGAAVLRAYLRLLESERC